jgi:hypothetical protein
MDTGTRPRTSIQGSDPLQAGFHVPWLVSPSSARAPMLQLLLLQQQHTSARSSPPPAAGLLQQPSSSSPLSAVCSAPARRAAALRVQQLRRPGLLSLPTACALPTPKATLPSGPCSASEQVQPTTQAGSELISKFVHMEFYNRT